jgi:ATP-dependent Lon protease
MDSTFPLADLQSIYSVADVGRAREDGAARRNEGLKCWYDRMFELGGSRYIIKPSTVSAVDNLYEASPNFAAVLDDLRKFLALAVTGTRPCSSRRCCCSASRVSARRILRRSSRTRSVPDSNSCR